RMRVIALHKHGGPEVLVEEDWPIPEPGPGEVLVRVEAVALNHLDLWVRKGLPGLQLEDPHLLGSDVAGAGAAPGPRVADIPVGQKIIVNPGISCGRCRECLSGRDNFCRQYGILGEHLRGGYAELIVVPAANVVPRPPSLSVAEAAAFPLATLTAWQMLVERARVRPGETVVVLGAGSGVGTAGVPVAKLLRARGVAAAASHAHAPRRR